MFIMQLIQLGEIILNEQLSLIIVDGKELPLDPKLLDLLLLFCRQADRIISRQEILDSVWAGSVVTDNAVNKLVANLRKELGDDPKNPKYIQTVPKRGYRLICPVLFNTSDVSFPEKESVLNTPTPLIITPEGLVPKRKKYLLISIVLMVLIGYALLLLRPSIINAVSTEIVTPSKNTQELTRMPGIEHSALMSKKQDYIVFLRENQQTGTQQLWRKDLISNNEYRVKGALAHISQLISLTVSNKSSPLVYLAQDKQQCSVVSTEWVNEKQLSEANVILDCSSFFINDIVWHAEKSQLIYSAKASNESKNRIYRFDLPSKTQQLLTQPDIFGLGNSGLDLSPDGKKLLIVNNDKAYNSQLFVLDLTTNELTPALSLNYKISEATWYHDSKRVLYFGPSPSHQIMINDLNGNQEHTLLNASDYLYKGFTRISTSQDILFSTFQANYSNRWLKQATVLKEINNSTVFDRHPALAHQSSNYGFISTRSGQEQLYYSNLLTGETKVISQFEGHQSFTSLSFSPSDDYMLLTERTRLWILPVAPLLKDDVTLNLNTDNINFKVKGKLIKSHWLTNDLLYFIVRNGKEKKHYLFDRTINQQIELTDRWSTLVTDHNQVNTLYLVDKHDHQLYQMPLNKLNLTQKNGQIRIPEQELKALQVYIPPDSYFLKIHQQKVHYITATDTVNLLPNSYKLHIKSLVPKGKLISKEVFQLKCNCGYDVADSGIMVSERISLEGDIHRTISKI